MANPDWQQNNDNFVIAGGTYIMIYMPYYFFKKKMSSEMKVGYNYNLHTYEYIIKIFFG